MSDQHGHPHQNGSSAPAQPQEPKASDAARIVQLNLRLDQRANEIRVLENREVELAALANDYHAEILGLRGALDQVAAENLLLRRRLGLPEVGPIEPLPEDDQPQAIEVPDDLRAVTTHNMGAEQQTN